MYRGRRSRAGGDGLAFVNFGRSVLEMSWRLDIEVLFMGMISLVVMSCTRDLT